LQQDTKYTLYPNGTITFPDNGTNTTYMYNTAQGENILLNMIDILNFVKSLSPGNASQLDGVIQIIQNSLPKTFIDISINKIFNYQVTPEQFSITQITDQNGDVNLRLNDRIPDQTLGLGIPDMTGTDNYNMTTQVVTSYISDTYPFSETFQPNTDEWANVLYWDLLDLQNALAVEQAAQAAGNTQLSAIIAQLQQWITTIGGWYNNYFKLNPNIEKSLRPLDIRRKALEEMANSKNTDHAMNVSRRTMKAMNERPAKTMPVVLPARKALAGKTDKAMNGGIDLTRNSTPLDVHNLGGAVNFNIDPAQAERILASPGLAPQIYTIDPLQSLPAFLGMSRQEIQQLSA
jgi:hypothetical protein